MLTISSSILAAKQKQSQTIIILTLLLSLSLSLLLFLFLYGTHTSQIPRPQYLLIISELNYLPPPIIYTIHMETIINLTFLNINTSIHQQIIIQKCAQIRRLTWLWWTIITNILPLYCF